MPSNVAGINETDSSGKSSLHLACSGGYLPVVQLLTQQGANLQAVDNEGNNALMHAYLGNGDASTVTWLIEQGLDVNHTNKQGSTAYHSAAGNGYLLLLQILKNKNANIQAEDESGDNALIWACTFSGDVNTVQCLVDQGVQVTHTNKGGFTAIHYAAQNGNPEIVECLHNCDARLINWPTVRRYLVLY